MLLFFSPTDFLKSQVKFLGITKIPLRYPRISKRAPLLSVPSGKPPYFDGEDYFMWSDKMRHRQLRVFFSAEGPQDKDIIGKVILRTLSVEGPQDKDLVWK